jgi:hypothetical protein
VRNGGTQVAASLTDEQVGEGEANGSNAVSKYGLQLARSKSIVSLYSSWVS